MVVFVMNFKNEPVELAGIGRWTDAESGVVYEGKLQMEAFGCVLLK